MTGKKADVLMPAEPPPEALNLMRDAIGSHSYTPSTAAWVAYRVLYEHLTKPPPPCAHCGAPAFWWRQKAEKP